MNDESHKYRDDEAADIQPNDAGATLKEGATGDKMTGSEDNCAVALGSSHEVGPTAVLSTGAPEDNVAVALGDSALELATPFPVRTPAPESEASLDDNLPHTTTALATCLVVTVAILANDNLVSAPTAAESVVEMNKDLPRQNHADAPTEQPNIKGTELALSTCIPERSSIVG